MNKKYLLSCKKYFRLFNQQIQEFLSYRASVFLSLLSQFISPLVMMWVLTSLPQANITMNQNQIIRYYLFTSILYILMSSKVDLYLKESIQHGELANYLTKPINFWMVALLKDTSERILKMTLALPIFIVLIFLYNQFTIFEHINLITLLPIIVISFLLSFILSFIFGLFTFWTEEVWGLLNAKEVAIMLLGGIALPYQFFPKSLEHFLTYTPFPYLVNWPLRVGFSGNIVNEFIIAISWTILLFLLGHLIWKKGLRKYCALGTY